MERYRSSMLSGFGFCAITFMLAASALPSAADSNLLSNTGFEQSAGSNITGWAADTDGAFQQVTEGRNGDKAIKFSTSSSTSQGVAFSQTVNVVPCKKYSLSVWIRTQSVLSTADAGTVRIEWLHNGLPVAVSMPSGPKGTSTWRSWNAGTFTSIAAADSARISLFVAKGTSGTIWWDDINFSPVKDPLFDCTLIAPNYRGWMYGSYPSSIQVNAKVDYAEYNLDPANLKINAKLTNKTTGEVLGTTSSAVTGADNTISLARPSLAAGNYTLNVSLANTGNAGTLGSFDYPLIQQAGNEPTAKCWIDQYNRIIVDGKPFFPFGLYTWVKDTAADMKIIADAGFNTVVPTNRLSLSFDAQKELYDVSRNLGLKTVPCLHMFFDQSPYWSAVNGTNGLYGESDMIRGTINAFKDDPSVIAWYLADEPVASDAGDLQAHYNIACNLDPGRPNWIVGYKPEDLRTFMSGFDVYGIDSYPVAWAPIDLVGINASAARQQLCSSRPAWHILQTHNFQIYGDPGARPPTYAEMRNMAYQCFCEGANGLILYSYDDYYRDPSATFEQRWTDIKKLSAEIVPMIPKLLSVDVPMKLSVTDGARIKHFCKAYSGKTYLYIINTSSLPASATVTVPRAVLSIKLNETLVTPDANKQIVVPLEPIGIAIVEVQDYPWLTSKTTGLSSVGLLVRTTGKVTPLDLSSFFIDDGSSAWVKVIVPAGTQLPPANSYVAVTGISSCDRIGDQFGRVLRVSISNDLSIIRR